MVAFGSATFYDPSCPPFGRSVFHNFLRTGSYITKLLSELSFSTIERKGKGIDIIESEKLKALTLTNLG